MTRSERKSFWFHAALTAMAGAVGLAFLTTPGCSRDDPPNDKARVVTYRTDSSNYISNSSMKVPRDVRAVRVYVYEDGKWRELHPGDIVRLEYLTADAIVVDPKDLTISVGGPDTPRVDQENK